MKNKMKMQLYDCLVEIKPPDKPNKKSKKPRQREKVQELSKISRVCFDKKHGKTTQDFYQCVQNEAERLLSN